MIVNLLTADGKYFLLNIYNLRQPIQMQLSEKQKIFSQFFSAFFRATFNFEHFQNEDNPHS